MMPPMVKQPTGEPGVVAPASTHIPAKPAPQGQDESTIPYKQQGKTADPGFIAHWTFPPGLKKRVSLSDKSTSHGSVSLLDKYIIDSSVSHIRDGALLD